MHVPLAVCLCIVSSFMFDFGIVLIKHLYSSPCSTYDDLHCRNVVQWFESNDVVVVCFLNIFAPLFWSRRAPVVRSFHVKATFVLNLFADFSHPQIEGYDWFGPVLASNQHHFAYVYSAFGPNTFPGLFSGFFKPSADVQKVVNEYRLALFDRFYVIGVQLRVAGLRLSRAAEESVWRTMLYLKTEAEASQAKPVVFYICADIQEAWDRAVSLFGKDVIFSASVAAGRVGRDSKEVSLLFCCVFISLLFCCV